MSVLRGRSNMLLFFWLGLTVSDSGHTVSFLARSSQHYLVVEERVLWSTAGEDAQPISWPHWWPGIKSANESPDRRQKHQKPRRQSCAVQPLPQTVIQDTIWYFLFFFNAYSYFYVYSHEGSMSPFHCRTEFTRQFSREVSRFRSFFYSVCGLWWKCVLPCVPFLIFQYPDHAQHVIEK